MSINAELLEILACPACHGELRAIPEKGPGKGPEKNQEDPEGLFCPACRVVYPVRDSIPVMLKEEAVPKAEWDGGSK